MNVKRPFTIAVWLFVGYITSQVTCQDQDDTRQGQPDTPEVRHPGDEMRWDIWTDWSSCSRRCGRGVTSRSRLCRSMIDGSNTHGCVGPAEQVKLCRNENCIEETGENAERCTELNERVYGGRRYRWRPYRHPRNKCQMACQPVGQGFYLGLERNVTDGTSCSRDDKQVCVQGMCKSSGCDDIIDSGAMEDRCGVCNGDGTGCRQVEKTFRESSKHGYSTIATIPAGATNIIISELKESRNYLAIKATDGSFQMNTEFKLSRFGDHPGAGTSFKYAQREGANCPGECIMADGPTAVALEIVVLFYTDNSGIKYTYNVPHTEQHRTSDYDITTDDVIVGGGSNVKTNGKKRPIFSSDFKFKKRHGHHRHQTNGTVVVESKDYQTEDNSTYTSENTTDEFNFEDGDEQTDARRPEEVSQPGIVEDTFTGIYIGGAEDKGRAPLETSAPVQREETEPVEENKGAPSSIEDDMYTNDNRDRSLYSWKFNGYTDCSVTCGEGKKSPILQCIVTDKNTTVMHKYCESLTKPSTEVLTCSKVQCPPSWKPTEWTQCSVTCGRGLQTRDYVCARSDDVKLRDFECNSIKPTSEEQSCDLGSCASGWFYSEWNEKCSEGCGDGVQQRNVLCVTGSSNSITACPASEKPDEEKGCRSTETCEGSWFTGPWSECNATCGLAYQTRSVLCVWRHHGNTMRVMDDSRCTGEEKPPTYMSCDKNECPPSWYMGKWGSCSESCGHGRRSRDVRCMDDRKQTSSGCSENARPPAEEACHLRACQPRDQTRAPPIETESSCKDSFPQCSLVLQARLCHFKYYGDICCSSCAKAKRQRTIRPSQ